MPKGLVFALMFLLISSLANAQQVDFWRVREGSPVTLVLGTGGECKGKVVKRIDGALSVKLSEASAACGEHDKVVTVHGTDVRAVEVETKRSGKKDAAKVAGAVGVAAGTGLLVTAVPPRAILPVLGGGLVGTRLLVKSTDKGSTNHRYVIYVSRVE